MFRTHSPYSPFFTSGLLSLDDEPDVPTSPTRRGSLPETGTREAFYFTIQPRSDDSYRSYLSLDLAESQSMRSASLKRKASQKSEYKPFRFPTITENTPAVPSLRLRLSRDSLRTIPSPKPAPSITLPQVPSSSPPRLPSLQPLPALDMSVITTTTKPPSIKRAHNRNLSVATTSTVSTRAKRHNRSEALARLEGRSGAQTAPMAGYYPKRNFMSMSDDEEEEEEDNNADADDESDENDRPLHPLMEEEDVVLPHSYSYLEAPRTAPLPPKSKFPPTSPLPTASSSSSKSSKSKATPTPTTQPPLRRQRTKRRTGAETTTSDWFPLKSFIDLSETHVHAHHHEQKTQRTLAGPVPTTKVVNRHPKPRAHCQNSNSNLRAMHPYRAVAGLSTTTSSSSSSGSGSTNGSSWSWRSFIEVANVA